MSHDLSPLHHKGEVRQPVLGKCGQSDCGFVWPVLYGPMPLHQVAECMMAARCPMCASRKVLTA
jgi:hypothetical protein